MQRAAFPYMSIYVGPREIPQMLRQTSRKEIDHIYVMSLGVIADKEDDFRAFLKLLNQRKAYLHSTEESITICPAAKCDAAVRSWKEARRNGIQKIGGRISAELRRKQSLEAAEKIRDRWPLPSKTWRTSMLLTEAGFTYNTAITILGPRPIAQYNYQAKLKRKKLKEDRTNA